MAELLIRMTDVNHADPAENLKAYKRGDVIVVQPDGFQWGRKESIEQWIADGNSKASWHGNTAIVKLPGVAVGDVQYLIESLYDVLELEPSTLIRRRNWKSDLDLLPTPIRKTLERDFVYTTTKAQFDVLVKYVGV